MNLRVPRESILGRHMFGHLHECHSRSASRGVCVVVAGLAPILWSSGVGSDTMKPIAAPIVGGMITSTVHVLSITPVIFYIMKTRALRKGLNLSRITQ